MAIITAVETKKPLYRVAYAFLLVGLSLLAILQFFPMVWMIIGGFKTDLELISPTFQLFPERWMVENYITAFTQYNFGKNIYNTAYLIIAIMVIQISNSALSAYSLSKIKPKGGKVIYMYFIATMMFSSTALLFPLYILCSAMGLIGSKWALIIASSTWAYCIFLFKNFYDGVPIELFEAAEIDGCGRFKSFTNILLPLAKPVMVVCIVQTFNTVYNDFLYPLMMLPHDKDWTIMIRIFNLDRVGNQSKAVLYVLMTVSTLPCLVVFMYTQKDIAQGISMTGIKG